MLTTEERSDDTSGGEAFKLIATLQFKLEVEV